MKRVSLAIIILIAISTVSCKKKYTCICKKDIYENHQNTNQETNIEEVKSKSHDQARNACIAKNYQDIDDEGTGYMTICDLLK